jgi:hypothetical protein
MAPTLALLRSWRLAKRVRPGVALALGAAGIAAPAPAGIAGSVPGIATPAPASNATSVLGIVAPAPGIAASVRGIAAPARAASGAPTAQAASTLSVRDEGHLHLAGTAGPWLIDEGPATGSLPGSVRVRFDYNGNPTVRAQFTIYTRGGSIAGEGQGTLNNPNSPSPSFRGSLSIAGGSGRYAHARGSGELYGVYYRRSLGLAVQTIGTLRY